LYLTSLFTFFSVVGMDHKEHKEKKEKKEPKKDKKEGKKEKKGGFQIKYKIKPCPPKGDGVVAKERIPKGELVLAVPLF
jgi:hypothetical protein